MEELIEWLEKHAKSASPASQTVYASVLRKIEELGLK